MKRTFLGIFLSIILCFNLIIFTDVPVYAEADPNSATYLYDVINLYAWSSACGSDFQIHPQSTGEHAYLFLPSNIKYSFLKFHHDGDGVLEAVNGDMHFVIENDTAYNYENYLSDDTGNGSRILTLQFTASDGNVVTGNLYLMRSSKIASLLINSTDRENEGRNFIESGKQNHTTATMAMVSAYGKEIYSGKISQIRCRGNNTFMADKKPYQIKLEKAANLLESGDKADKDKTWLLLANARDASLVRNSVALGIAKNMGLDTPDFRPVDLYYDGEYHGSYLLCEKIEVDKGRLDIYDLDKKNKEANGDTNLDELDTVIGQNKYGDTIQYVDGMDSPSDYSKGYLIESDNAYYESERCYFILSNGAQFSIKAPSNCSKEEVEFISEYMEEALQAALSGGINPDTGKSVWEYMDQDSMIKYYVLQEATRNPDAYASSGFLYLDETDGPMISGPAWDFDVSYGLSIEDEMSIDGFRCTEDWIEWIYAFIQLDDFRLGVKEYYENEGYNIVRGNQITKYISQISDSQKMEREFCARSMQSYMKQETYEEDIAYLRNYAVRRADWLLDEFGSW